MKPKSKAQTINQAKKAIARANLALLPSRPGPASFWIPDDATEREIDTLQRVAVAENNLAWTLARRNAENEVAALAGEGRSLGGKTTAELNKEAATRVSNDLKPWFDRVIAERNGHIPGWTVLLNQVRKILAVDCPELLEKATKDRAVNYKQALTNKSV